MFKFNPLALIDLCNRFADRCVCLDLRSVIFGEFRLWLSEVLQVDLEATVDISCAKYEHTGNPSDNQPIGDGVFSKGFFLTSLCFYVFADVLLCHDDELEGRRVAFILYLVPPWEVKDGGTLDLFSTDGLWMNISDALLL